jgi:membrane protein implicated in regulation of membrane protease activity
MLGRHGHMPRRAYALPQRPRPSELTEEARRRVAHRRVHRLPGADAGDPCSCAPIHAVVLIISGLALLLVLHVVGGALGLSLLAAAVAFEAAEKGYLVWWTRRLPPAAGPEVMVGCPVTVVSACRPMGRVRFGRESWQALCAEGAEVGETLRIEAVERSTLVVASAGAVSQRPGLTLLPSRQIDRGPARSASTDP